MAAANTPRYLVVHTAAWPGDPSAADIDRAHRQQGWNRIGYHYVIRKDGTVEAGRPERQIGAHCKDGGMNRQSVGICFSGHHNREDWTPQQTEAFGRLAVTLCRQYGIVPERVIGHREAGARKDCPGTRIDMHQVRAYVKACIAGSVLGAMSCYEALSPLPPEPLPGLPATPMPEMIR